MKKTITYLSLVLSFLFMLNSGKSIAQCTANFSYTVNANGNVNFLANCASVNSITTQYHWNFGNSTTYSTTGSPIAQVTYTANGTYTVNLFYLTPSTCSNSVSYTINITNAITPTCNINTNFSYTQGSNGLVNFNSTSTGTVPGTSYAWVFGDATPNGTGVSTPHTYSANGTYNVILYANNNFTATCMDSVILPVTVTSYSTPCGLTANFVFTQGVNGQVSFTSTSTGTVSTSSYTWKYGDATPNGSGDPSSHTYAANGTYMATLTVNNTVTCVSSITKTIVVNSISVTPCNLVANYTHTVGSGGSVNFANASTGTNPNATYYWDFGDGFTSANPSPLHTYSSAGAYNVLLFVNNQTTPTCIDTIVQSVNVTGIACVANSNFTLAPSTTTLVWNATPASPWNVVAASWNWGDNSSSNMLYASHTYSASGTYSICLSVTVSCGNSSSTCVNQFVFKSASPEMAMIQVNVIPPALTPTAIKDTEIENVNYLIYPNPNSGQFDLKMESENNETVKIKVYNLIGEVVYETETINDNMTKKINLDNVANGVYFVKINSGNKESTKKMIINK